MNSKVLGVALVCALCWCFFADAQNGAAARISLIDGRANILRLNGTAWQLAKVNMPLMTGDQLYSDKESFVEITYSNNEIVRIDENSKLVITLSTDKNVRTGATLGKVWVNMKKLSAHGREFEVSSPTAVAAIRGTIFQMTVAKDSSTSVGVFDGKVAVGPSDALKKKLELSKSAAPSSEETPGPQEVPGPYEVSLEQWRTIIAGQRISVRTDGKCSTEPIDQSKNDAFVKRNLELDKSQ